MKPNRGYKHCHRCCLAYDVRLMWIDAGKKLGR